MRSVDLRVWYHARGYFGSALKMCPLHTFSATNPLSWGLNQKMTRPTQSPTDWNTAWISWQLAAGLTHRDRQLYTLIYTKGRPFSYPTNAWLCLAYMERTHTDTVRTYRPGTFLLWGESANHTLLRMHMWSKHFPCELVWKDCLLMISRHCWAELIGHGK